jgi:hypothetical protein
MSSVELYARTWGYVDRQEPESTSYFAPGSIRPRRLILTEHVKLYTKVYTHGQGVAVYTPHDIQDYKSKSSNDHTPRWVCTVHDNTREIALKTGAYFYGHFTLYHSTRIVISILNSPRYHTRKQARKSQRKRAQTRRGVFYAL